jgi:hypothetical protein
MRVTCPTFEEFLECLRDEPAEAVLQKAVRAAIIHRQPNQPGGHGQVIFQASAVISIGTDGGEYLLEVGVDAGRDYYDASGDNSGTIAAEGMREQLRGVCSVLGLKLKPGIIEI